MRWRAWLTNLLLATFAAISAAAIAGDAPPLMLANVYRGQVDLGAYWVSEKYDGVRGYWDGTRLLTRGGETVMAPAWFTAGWPAVPLDGELWAGRGRFAQAVSTVRSQQTDDRAWRDIRFMVFDLPGIAEPFDRRKDALDAAVSAIGKPWVQAVAQLRVKSPGELQAMLDRVVREGGEGLVLHRGASLYRAERNDDLLKLKPYDDAEARVVGHLPGAGRFAGMLGALLVEMPDGRRFRIGSGLTEAQRRAPPPLGAWITYRYNGVNPRSGLPRFARFLRERTDLPDVPPA
ncbi:MAG TPA: DNA ligase [Rhodocyclaceae bacterium]|nr:DNA ligase [Rhodocyclaceae bacterium]HNB78152.1 DNA ligase [Rhodocyclaceae bacterium]HNC60247.1 DNA ligase [Rhodocyclaceae bacterium]HNH11947.1 DNA ligase [Rhodocyclaceae bacterium]HNH98141.1 DNA ligase [Rhodocyclaceae bacterium]